MKHKKMLALLVFAILLFVAGYVVTNNTHDDFLPEDPETPTALTPREVIQKVVESRRPPTTVAVTQEINSEAEDI